MSSAQNDLTPGSVAEEAALLREVLRQRGGLGASLAGGLLTGLASAHRPTDADATTGSPSTEREARAGSEDGPEPDAAEPGSARRQACTCGGATPQVCRSCPVCLAISVARSVRPETLDRAADVVMLAVTALRDLAEHRREEQAAGRPPQESHEREGAGPQS